MSISRTYKEVVTGNKYDLERAGKQINDMYMAKVKAKDVPDIVSAFIDQNHVGCCLHYGMKLFKLLREASIEAYIAITLEENPATHEKTDSHVSVCYVIDDKRFIADPVETVKLGQGDYSAIPIEIFKREQGTIWLYDPYSKDGEKLFLEGFLDDPIETLMDN